MKSIEKVIDEKKYDVLMRLIMMLHRENLELMRVILATNMKPDESKELFSKIESDWEGIQKEVISKGFKVSEEDLKND